jgi:hypothetical protein
MLQVELRCGPAHTNPTRTSIIFGAQDFYELQEIQVWVRDQTGENYGYTIPSIEIKQNRSLQLPVPNRWEELANQLHYTTGEATYDEDCPVFRKRGIRRD